MKKKLLSVLLAGAMVLSLAACGSKEAAPADTSSDTAATTTEASDSADTSDAASDSADASDPTGGQLECRYDSELPADEVTEFVKQSAGTDCAELFKCLQHDYLKEFLLWNSG